MDDVFSIVEGRFGTVAVREIEHDLIMHAHADMQFGYWMGGGAAHANMRSIQAGYNEAVVVGVNSYHSHDFILDPPHTPVIVLLLNIHLPWLDDVRRELGNPVVLTTPQILCTPKIRAASWSLMKSTMTFREGKSKTFEAEVLHLLRLTIEQATYQMLPVVFPARRKLIDYRLRLALDYMQNHIGTDMAIGEVAKLVGLSRSRLYELFQSELSSSPQVIWNSMRMKWAIKKVGMGEDDLAHVASSLGFSTAGNFSRFFRSMMGVSPLFFRKRNLLNKKMGEKMYAIAYTSCVSHAMTPQQLEKILRSARARNAQLNVTGILLYAGSCFIQYLEGLQRDLLEVLDFVTAASQHHQINMGDLMPIQKRAYPDTPLTFIGSYEEDLTAAIVPVELHKFLTLCNL